MDKQRLLELAGITEASYAKPSGGFMSFWDSDGSHPGEDLEDMAYAGHMPEDTYEVFELKDGLHAKAWSDSDYMGVLGIAISAKNKEDCAILFDEKPDSGWEEATHDALYGIDIWETRKLW